MVALEEATRKKAMYKRSKYSGPMIRFHSKKIQDVGLVSTIFGCFGNVVFRAYFVIVGTGYFPYQFTVPSQGTENHICCSVLCCSLQSTRAAQCMNASTSMALLQLERYIGLQACQGTAGSNEHGCMRPRLCPDEQPKPGLRMHVWLLSQFGHVVGCISSCPPPLAVT